MKHIILALTVTIILASPSIAGTVRCHEFVGDTICDDGSRTHTFAGTTTTTRPGHKPIKCHTFAGTTTCRD